MILNNAPVQTAYPAGEPAQLRKADVFQVAEQFAAKVGYVPGGDLEEVVSKLGGKIEIRDFPAVEQSGSIRVNNKRDFVIVLPTYTGRLRDRFTIAHELGHYVLHSQLGKRQIEVPRLASGRAEWEANWFAGAFLMPEKLFTEKLQAGMTEDQLAAFFDVSPGAVQVRKMSLES